MVLTFGDFLVWPSHFSDAHSLFDNASKERNIPNMNTV